MTEVVFRNASVADAAGMRGLWRRFWPEQPYEAHLETKIAAEPDLVLVAELDGEIIGTVIGGFDGWWAWVYRIAVAEEHHKQGIATRLLEEIHKRLKARGATGVGAIVSPSNTSVHRLLGKLGYQDHGYRNLGMKL